MVADLPPDNFLDSTLAAAKTGFLHLNGWSGQKRNQAIAAIAEHLTAAFDQILEANTLDLEVSREMAVTDCLLDWLKLTPQRLETTVDILTQLAQLPDPLQRVMAAPYQLNPSQTYCQSMPLGVVALVYEAFPELGAIAAGFCLKAGNSLILRSCGVSSHSAATICQLLNEALVESNLTETPLIYHLPADEMPLVQDLVSRSDAINLVIPYGRPSFVDQINRKAAVPVLPAAMGNCYLYWSNKGELDLVRQMILASYASEPDPVNAIEKVLLNPQLNSTLLLRLFNNLQEKGFKLRGDSELCALFPEQLTLAKETEWPRAYLDKTIAFRSVPDLKTAIAWINHCSSGHGDSIATNSYQESRQFAMGIDSALVYINTPPYFCRNPRQGESLFLGVSNQKGQRRGLIGLEAFTTPKQVVNGEVLMSENNL